MFLIRNTNNIKKFVRYSHERSSLLDILSQKKNINLYQSKVVINLYGEKKIVDYASLEIKLFSEEKFIINKCYNITYHNIILLNSIIIRNWKQPYNLYIDCNNNIIHKNFNECYHQFNDIYNIHSEKEIKKQQIKKIFDH